MAALLDGASSLAVIRVNPPALSWPKGEIRGPTPLLQAAATGLSHESHESAPSHFVLIRAIRG